MEVVKKGGGRERERGFVRSGCEGRREGGG